MLPTFRIAKLSPTMLTLDKNFTTHPWYEALPSAEQRAMNAWTKSSNFILVLSESLKVQFSSEPFLSVFRQSEIDDDDMTTDIKRDI